MSSPTAHSKTADLYLVTVFTLGVYINSRERSVRPIASDASTGLEI